VKAMAVVAEDRERMELAINEVKERSKTMDVAVGVLAIMDASRML